MQLGAGPAGGAGAVIIALVGAITIACSAPTAVPAELQSRCTWVTDEHGQPTATSERCYRQWAEDVTGTATGRVWRISRVETDDLGVTVLTGPSRTKSADVGERAIRAAEISAQITGHWPRRDLVIVDGSDQEPEAGRYLAGVITIGAAAERVDEREWIAAHEAAHAWWQNDVAWVNEGMAETVAGLATGQAVPMRLEAACEWDTLGEWMDRGRPDPTGECAVSLGTQAMRMTITPDGQVMNKLGERLHRGDAADRAWAVDKLITMDEARPGRAGAPDHREEGR